LTFPKNPTEHDIDVTLKEVVETGLSELPVRIHYTAYEHYRKQVIHHHWHNELEILYIVKGAVKLTVEGQTFVAQAGDVITIPSKYIHSGINESGESCALYAIVFDWQFIACRLADSIHKKYIAPLLDTPAVFFMHLANNQALVQILQQMIEIYGRQSTGYEIFIKAQFYLFLYELGLATQAGAQPVALHAPHISHNRDNHSYACRKTVAYIEKNLANPISLEEIACYVGFNREYFCRFFKKNFGLSFSKYLNQYRVQCAEHYLLNTDKKVIDISTELGFVDANYFASVFKKLTGETPTSYRKNQR